MRIGIVAGESSGDLLGAGLIEAIRESNPDVEFEGVAGPEMIAKGCRALFPADKLSIMGLVDAVIHYRELRGIRDQLRDHFLADPPDLVVGIDVPDFNLTLLEQLHSQGIATIQYVSPQVWAWRKRRVKKIARAVDRVLTLFPFEADFYKDNNVPVSYVGHPFADQIPMSAEQDLGREALGLIKDRPVVAILPGSRVSEVKHLASVFLETANWCYARNSEIQFVVPLANAAVKQVFLEYSQKLNLDLPITIIDGQARQAMQAADVILLSSGTATLEALLLKRPMVVAYRFSWLNYYLLRLLVHIRFFSLPNLLAAKELVPEYVQNRARPDVMGTHLLEYLHKPELVQQLVECFTSIHHELRQQTNKKAAAAVLDLIELRSSAQVN